jgi:hypothetical protein
VKVQSSADGRKGSPVEYLMTLTLEGRKIMRQIKTRVICGVVLMGLLAAGIASTHKGAGLTAVLRAQTVSEAQAEEPSGDYVVHGKKNLRCNDDTIQGRYAVRIEGSLVGIGPFAAVGLFTFDGSGNLTNAATTSTNGNIITGVTAGTYTVNDDCTGQMSFPSISGPPLTFNFVIADRGNEIYLIATRAPAVLSGVGKRIDKQ